MSYQWGEYMTLLATQGFPSCSNTNYLAGTSNPDFGAGTSNPDFGACTYNFELEYYTPNIVIVTQGLDNIDIHYTKSTQSHTPLSENFIPHENDEEDPIGDSFANESDDASEPSEVEYPIPPEDGPNDVEINVIVEIFAQGMTETSSELAMPNRTTQPIFYRSIPFFEQTFPEIPTDSVDVPNLRYAKFYNKFEGRLDVGMLFKKKEELMEAVQDHSIRHARRKYYVSESSRTKWRVLCKHNIEGFQFCRKSISVDGTHLYTKYKHTILIAAAMDGNQQDLCWQAGSKYQLRKFNRIMEEIKKQNVGAFVFLDQINKKKWTASHDGGWRFGILTTNMSECINGVLKWTRRLPSEDYWDDPNFQLVHDPTIRIFTRPGRNQTTRIHNEMDWRQTRIRQEAQQQRDSSIQENMPEEDCS
ncbi:hypothetical protein Sango_2722100 [Sesamum angolense]|uniref:Transposase n=1 Tax=Sesamum angolense TaxID=2727404 RepID=A0AAE1T8X2_9LAMI|nr:hypothetical protein Sango_2722100 [Sesamum angolense]